MLPTHYSAAFRPRWSFAALAVALVVALSGCAQTYKIKVEALHNPAVSTRHDYCLVPKDDVKADFNPHFVAATELVRAALATRGLHEAGNPRDAGIVIEFDYGLGSRRAAISQLESVASSRTESNPALRVVQMYEKYVSLVARESDAAARLTGRKPAELWRVTVSLEDEERSAEPSLPALVAAATDRIGESTDVREIVRLAKKSEPVLFVQGR